MLWGLEGHALGIPICAIAKGMAFCVRILG
jgi:hypothetical protein